MTKYVIVKGSKGAGLGDRIFGLATGLLYAEVTGRTLHIDWRDGAYGDPTDNLFPKLLQVHDLPVSDELPATVDVAPAIWRGRLQMPLSELRSADLQQRGIVWTNAAPAWNRAEAIARYSIDPACLDHSETAVVLWAGDSIHPLVAALQAAGRLPASCSVDEARRDVLRRHLHYHDEIKSRIDRIVGELFETGGTIGVHYRLTEEAARARSVPTRRQYHAAVAAHLRRFAGARIFLATDNRDVQQDFVQTYGRDRVCWIEKWLPDAGASIHMNADCPDGVSAARDALVDVGLLARCTSLVLTGNSAFSLLAANLSAAADGDRTTVYPENGSLLRRGARSAFRQLKRATSGLRS